MEKVSKYDLVIVGGGVAGISCAYNASKLGLKTLLIEKNKVMKDTTAYMISYML